MAANAFEDAVPAGAITHPPSSNEYLVDRGFRALAVCGAWLIILLVAYILWKIGGQALPAIYRYHLGFLWSTNWNVQDEKFGILPEIWGTLYSPNSSRATWSFGSRARPSCSEDLRLSLFTSIGRAWRRY